jgi:spermidine synthase
MISRMKNGSGTIWLIAGLFFISGGTALIGEVVWMRMLGLVLGNTIWAASAAVAVWIGGMALGAWIGARLAPRVQHHLRLYGIAEGLIGLFFAFSPSLHGLLLSTGTLLGPDLSQSLVLGLVQRILLSVAALLLPTVLMGLTLPLLVERIRGLVLSGRVSLLYGANTLGAATGVFIAAYLTLPHIGESGSLAAAGCACALVAVIAIVCEGLLPGRSARAQEIDWAGGERWYLWLAAAMGLSALAAELVWVRILVLHLGSRVYAFSLLLGVYLVGIGLGSVALLALSKRIESPRRALAWIQLTAAIMLCGQVVALGFVDRLLQLLADTIQADLSFSALQGIMLIAVAILFLPVTLLFGASFPLAVAADPAHRSAGAHTGMVAAANTLGAIVGALGAPFLLVPWIGCQRTLLLLVLVHLAVALTLRRRWSTMLPAAVGLIAAAIIWTVLPGDWVLRQANVDGSKVELIELEESLSGTVLVKRYREPAGTWLSLEINGINVAGSSPALLAVQQLQGNLPLMQLDNPQQVLHIGFGSGGTCWAVSRYPVEEIDVVEISPDVLAVASTHFPFINHNVLDDPRVRVVLNDGRNYLLATERRYDAILSDSIHPVFAGNSTLYTVEYFQMCRDRLKPGGIVSMWLPLYSLDQRSFLRILSAFHSVFPNTTIWYDTSTINEFTIVSGKVEPGPLKINWSAFDNPEIAGSLEIAGVTKPADIVANFLLGPAEVSRLVAEQPVHEDDLPFVEYMAGRTLLRELTWYQNLRTLVDWRSRVAPFAPSPVSFAEAAATRDEKLQVALDVLLSRLNKQQ